MKFVYILLLLSGMTVASVLTAMDDACKNNVAEACYELGSIYLGNDGIPADFEESKKYLTKACDLNHDKSCLMLEKINIEITK